MTRFFRPASWKNALWNTSRPAKRRKLPRSNTGQAEMLEGRQLLSATANGSAQDQPGFHLDQNGTLFVTGSDGNDRLDCRSYFYGDFLLLTTGSDSLTFSLDGVEHIVAHMGAGDDVVDLSQSSLGGLWHDPITTIFGEAGNDTLCGTHMTDILDGGSGDDHLEAATDFGFSGFDTLIGGDGNDTVSIVNYLKLATVKSTSESGDVWTCAYDIESQIQNGGPVPQTDSWVTVSDSRISWGTGDFTSEDVKTLNSFGEDAQMSGIENVLIDATWVDVLITVTSFGGEIQVVGANNQDHVIADNQEHISFQDAVPTDNGGLPPVDPEVPPTEDEIIAVESDVPPNEATEFNAQADGQSATESDDSLLDSTEQSWTQLGPDSDRGMNEQATEPVHEDGNTDSLFQVFSQPNLILEGSMA